MEQITADNLLARWKENQNSTIKLKVDGKSRTPDTYYTVALNDAGRVGDKGAAKWLEKYSAGRPTVVLWSNGTERKEYELVGTIPTQQAEVNYTMPQAQPTMSNDPYLLILQDHNRKLNAEYDDLWRKYKALFDDYGKAKILADTYESEKRMAVQLAKTEAQNEHKGLSGVQVEGLVNKALENLPGIISAVSSLRTPNTGQLAGGNETINRINTVLGQLQPQVQQYALEAIGQEVLSPGFLENIVSQVQAQLANHNGGGNPV